MSHLSGFGRVSRSIANAHKKAKRNNTKTAYRPKIIEFLQLCDSLYDRKIILHTSRKRKLTVLGCTTLIIKNILPKIENQRWTLLFKGLIASIMTT